MMVAFISVLAAVASAIPVDRASWFNAGDYPPEAVTRHIEGEVTFEVDVDPVGKPIKCRVIKSSGQPVLDQRTCDVVLSRAHFRPAIDRSGKPAPGSYSSHTIWELTGGATGAFGSATAIADGANEKGQAARALFSADDYPAEAIRNGWEGVVVADLTVNTAGRVSTCTVVESSGHDVLDQTTCEIMRKRAMFKPATDEAGRLVEDHIRTPPIKWALSGTAASLPQNWRQMEPGHFLCSEPAGQTGDYEISPLPVGKSIKFRFRFDSDTYDPTATQAVALLFQAPAAQMQIVVGKFSNEWRHIYVGLLGARKEDHDWVVLEMLPNSTDWIDVKLELDSKGVVQAVTENGKGLLPLGTTQPVRTFLHCQSGAFEIEMSPTASVLHALRP